MSETIIKKANKLQGAISLPGDKSISHRAALLSLLCENPLTVTNYSDAADCQNTLNAVKSLGGQIHNEGDSLIISPPPDEGMKSPFEPINCGNSGTTMRLLAGLLSGASISATLIGDDSLSSRPMGRIAEPLRLMNAEIEISEDNTAPIRISPGTIIPIDYTLPVASAQVKSALILAGLASKTDVIIRERSLTRDHTERMISYLDGDLRIEDVKMNIVPDPVDPRKKKKVLSTDAYKRSIFLGKNSRISGGEINVPGDISTAAFFIAAALLVKDSHLIIKDIGVNNTRMGLVKILKQMGARINIKNRREISGEPIGDIEVFYSKLKPRKISGNIIPGLIDEIPILAVMAANIEGTTIIRDAEELRHKESDRIKAVCNNLAAMGVKVGEFPDGMAIEGTDELEGAEIDSFGDHRIAMAFAVAGITAHGQTVINNSDVVSISCPKFFTLLDGLRIK
ncbi:MAG: 3-phosphoshikimate 1-carboxyvinyltransferase [candidate division Zixibacteria bacterium]